MNCFEHDDKNLANPEKHGIDFLAAQRLWQAPDLLAIQARSDDEPRFLVIGLIGRKHWSAVVTFRNGKIRLISVRRSRTGEGSLAEICNIPGMEAEATRCLK
ncbi:MAG: BrnT family toxin [Desulforhopalus sp.]|jgi:uncharacterized DUF497 family protein|nr:BrnT family toxin [Desulforhopalus sp.]